MHRSNHSPCGCGLTSATLLSSHIPMFLLERFNWGVINSMSLSSIPNDINQAVTDEIKTRPRVVIEGREG